MLSRPSSLPTPIDPPNRADKSRLAKSGEQDSFAVSKGVQSVDTLDSIEGDNINGLAVNAADTEPASGSTDALRWGAGYGGGRAGLSHGRPAGGRARSTV